ncbi:MAG: hypothetical protein E7568_04975 [Ruminococcaceae bacterium]|nr:hypothetical protein [Oscillospiraceae bacterium]
MVLLVVNSIGYFEISPKATIEYHIIVQTIPSPPIADKTNDKNEVLILQYALTVLENIKQKTAEINKLPPDKINTAGKPLNKLKVKKYAVGVSAPPIIPT